jgi:predicted nucleotidyltransferase component of viral defense system
VSILSIIGVMNIYNSKQFAELFHLLFLDQLSRKLDKKFYALKGGGNLRFYFKSIRYSEDIDLDVKIISKDTLQKKVNAILASMPFQQILLSKGMSLVNITASKQTSTTQRWKFALQIPNATLPVNTKIEFSRRNFDEEVEFAGIDTTILQAYKLAPILLNHYSANTACQQKIVALANRSQAQVRDVFDIYLLLTSYAKQIVLSAETLAYCHQAQKQLSNLSFQDYQSQVVSYLSVEQQKQYDNEDLWNNIVKSVKLFMEHDNASY